LLSLQNVGLLEGMRGVAETGAAGVFLANSKTGSS